MQFSVKIDERKKNVGMFMKNWDLQKHTEQKLKSRGNKMSDQ
jgi:hypothetical protein